MSTKRFQLTTLVVIVAALGALLAPLARPTAAGAQPASFTFEGGGWGHGVGMSQYGAYGRAAAGQNHAQILGHYYAGTAVTTQPSVNDLRIHLATVPNVTLTPDVGLTASIDGVALIGAPVATPVVVGSTGDRFAVTTTGELCPAGGCPGSVLSIPLALTSPVLVSATGDRYARGRLDIIHSGDGNVHVVVAGLTMQQYLYGLAEMPQSWPLEALRSQAIAGRSYAQNVTVSRRADPAINWDLSATTTDQAYGGYDQELTPTASRWIDAVNSTADRYVTYQGNIIQAFYSSSNGGYSEDSGYVFSTSLPYLDAAADTFDSHQNPYGSWSRSYSAADLSRWLAARSDTDVGTVTGVSLGGNIGESGRLDRATITLTGTGGTKTVTGSRFRTVVNLGVAADGGGRARQLLSTKFRPVGFLTLEPLRPIGILDAAAPAADGSGDIRAVGWALDGNISSATTMHLYVDGQIVDAGPANLPRQRLGTFFPLHGPNHGFDLRGEAGVGRHDVCVFAINIGPGAGNSLVGCQVVTVTDQRPIGALDVVVDLDGTTAALGGWALDVDVDAPVPVHVYVNGVLRNAVVADRVRDDVAAFFGVSPQHGYLTTVPVSVGDNQICVFGINQGPGTDNSLIGCKNLVVRDQLPFGSLDVARPEGGQIRLGGWVVDLDRDDPVVVHAYVDGQLVGATRADRERPDVGAFFTTAPERGFLFEVPAGPGGHEVCLYGLNAGPGSASALIGCRDVTL